ncbi:MAG: CHAD domain-containing protein [Defluviicoccus sp.]|nr:MAG: CHAD domain-containing protein [Defluviicoccus sp.]
MTTDDAVKTQDVATGAPPSQDPPDPTWQKARLPSLVPSTTAEEALADIVHGCVEHLRSNTACVMARAHEEGIHQMRVAVRRLRSCLALYAPFLPVDQHKYLVGELKWLIGELGPARDWDVFVGEILKPVLIQLGDEEDRLSELSLHVESSAITPTRGRRRRFRPSAIADWCCCCLPGPRVAAGAIRVARTARGTGGQRHPHCP